MQKPQLHDQSRADLANTGAVFDNAMNTTPDVEASNALRGTDSARGLLKPNETFERGLGGGSADPAMSQAIQNKYMGKFERENSAFKRVEKLEAKKASFDRLAQANQMVGQEMEMNFQKRLEKFKREKASRAARGAIVGQVLGTVVGIVAGIYTGGAGAAAGYAAGNAAGNAMAGD